MYSGDYVKGADNCAYSRLPEQSVYLMELKDRVLSTYVIRNVLSLPFYLEKGTCHDFVQ